MRLNHYLHSSTNISSNISIPAISDSGSSGHYAYINSQCTNMCPASNNSITITFPNSNQARSTHIGLLPNENLLLKACIVHLFLGIQNKFLISLSQLCDTNMTVSLTKHKLHVFNDSNLNKIIMERTRNTTDGMWYLHLVPVYKNHHYADSICDFKIKNDSIPQALNNRK